MTLSKELQSAAQRWCRLWQVDGLLEAIEFRDNLRLRTTVARWVQTARCVEFGPRFKRLRKRQAEVLCHELAHAAATHRYGTKISPHGLQWQLLVREAGFTPATRFKMSGLSVHTARHRSAAGLFEHRCRVCQSVRYGRRAVSRWRCVECVQAGLSGTLTITPARRSN